MPPRMTIACDDHIAFIISRGNAGPSALMHPLWLRPPANENARVESRLRLIESSAPTSAA
jgi:hypothetical protein